MNRLLRFTAFVSICLFVAVSVAQDMPATNESTTAIHEDCVSFNPAKTTASQIQGSWKVVDPTPRGLHWMHDFGRDEGAAVKTVRVIQHYNVSKSCFVGRPHAVFHYLLSRHTSPVGPLAEEDCLSFNPTYIQVVKMRGRWKIVEGEQELFDFKGNEADARQALAILRSTGSLLSVT